jgi:hypothetical protein
MAETEFHRQTREGNLMPGTTVAIARLLRNGTRTLAECACLLGMDRGQLEDRLNLMVRQGYLARITVPAPGGSCTCGHCCASCLQSRDIPAPAIFILTPKGDQLVSRS